jgi:hypothetical protein
MLWRIQSSNYTTRLITDVRTPEEIFRATLLRWSWIDSDLERKFWVNLVKPVQVANIIN